MHVSGPCVFTLRFSVTAWHVDVVLSTAAGSSAIQLLLQMQSKANADRKSSEPVTPASLSSVASTLISLSQAMPAPVSQAPESASSSAEAEQENKFGSSIASAAKFSPTASENLMRIIQAQKSSANHSQAQLQPSTASVVSHVTSPPSYRNVSLKPIAISPMLATRSADVRTVKMNQPILPAPLQPAAETMPKFVLQPNLAATSSATPGIVPQPLQILPVQLFPNPSSSSAGVTPQPQFIIIGGGGQLNSSKSGAVAPQILALPPGAQALPFLTPGAAGAGVALAQTSPPVATAVTVAPPQKRPSPAVVGVQQSGQHVNIPPTKRQMLSFQQQQTVKQPPAVTSSEQSKPIVSPLHVVSLPGMPNVTESEQDSMLHEFPLTGMDHVTGITAATTSELSTASNTSVAFSGVVTSRLKVSSDASLAVTSSQPLDSLAVSSSTHASGDDNSHVICSMVSEGFDSIFRDIKLQVEGLEAGASEQPAVSRGRPKSARVCMKFIKNLLS